MADDALMRNKIFSTTTVMLLLASCQPIFAAGFMLHEQATTRLGNAYAGTASTIEDASTAYYNPAGLVELKNAQIVMSGIYVNGNIKLYNATATNNVGTAVASPSSTKPASNAFIPGLFMSANINKKWAVGLSVAAPFGLSSKYSSDSIARFMGTTSKISTMDISPVVAYKINNMFDIGVGFDAMRLQATISSDIHFLPGADGYTNNYGNCWTYGYHAGILFKPSNDTKMGLVYYSTFNPHVKGHVDTARYPISPAPTTLYSDIKLPDHLVYSVTHAYNDQWTGMADIEFVHWSRLKELRITYNTGRYTLEELQYKNTFRFSFGGNYRYSQSLMFKGGVAFDQTPVQARLRTVRLPDSDRYWLALGAKYMINKYISLDAAYAHLFLKKATIAETGAVPGDTAKSLYGNYRSSADLVGVQLTWNFV